MEMSNSDRSLSGLYLARATITKCMPKSDEAKISGVRISPSPLKV